VNKRKGTAYEYRFFSNILDRGYELFIPAGEDIPVDCVVQNGAGKLFKVQIKGTKRLLAVYKRVKTPS
jgi:hypothetical protein